MLRSLLFILIIFFYSAHAYSVITPQFFQIGVDADVDVETTVRLDPELMWLLRSLPSDLRKEAIIAMNAIFDRADASTIKAFQEAQRLADNTLSHTDKILQKSINNLMAELRATVNTFANKIECSGQVLIDDFFSQARDSFPFVESKQFDPKDSCVKKSHPGKGEIGSVAKLDIAECWFYEGATIESKPSVIAAGLGNLAKLAHEATCLNKGSPAVANSLRLRQARFAHLFSVYDRTLANCPDAKSCLNRYIKKTQATADVMAQDDFDVAIEKERLSSTSESLNEMMSETTKEEPYLSGLMSAIKRLIVEDKPMLIKPLNAFVLQVGDVEDALLRKKMARNRAQAQAAYTKAVETLNKAAAKLSSTEPLLAEFNHAQSNLKVCNALIDPIKVTKVDFDRAYALWYSLSEHKDGNNVFRARLIERAQKCSTDAKIMLERKGPPKGYRELREGIYRVRSHWRNGYQDHWCLDKEDVSQHKGVTKIGAKSGAIKGPHVSILKVVRSCIPRNHCDGYHEWCEAWERNAGCLVSTEWLNWYQKTLPLHKSTYSKAVVCSARQSPWY